jgi:putative transposase
VYLNDYANPKEARCGLAAYLHFYDYHRLHQALNYQTPAAVYYATQTTALPALSWPQATA